MKLIRHGKPNEELPGIIDSLGRMRDVSAFVDDYDASFWRNMGIDGLLAIVTEHEKSLPYIDPAIRLGPPVASPSKMICIGLNYADHARESGMEPPSEPVIFFKSPSAICGPFDQVILPPGSQKTDWEVELALVISREAKHIDPHDATAHIGGYLVHNDISERAYQLEHGGQWVKGKSYDTFAPLGPWLVPAEQVKDPLDLSIWLDVNGQRMQDSSTKELIFSPAAIIAYVSNYMTLLPGDIISTGTPPGVGLGMQPPTYLQPGDTMHLGIEGLGSSSQTVHQVSPPH